MTPGKSVVIKLTESGAREVVKGAVFHGGYVRVQKAPGIV